MSRPPPHHHLQSTSFQPLPRTLSATPSHSDHTPSINLKLASSAAASYCRSQPLASRLRVIRPTLVDCLNHLTCGKVYRKKVWIKTQLHLGRKFVINCSVKIFPNFCPHYLQKLHDGMRKRIHEDSFSIQYWTMLGPANKDIFGTAKVASSLKSIKVLLGKSDQVWNFRVVLQSLMLFS